ncbi:hypothetical protein HN51_070238, partial [Arachis hypogaea]
WVYSFCDEDIDALISMCLCLWLVIKYGFEFQQIVDIGKTLPLFMERQTLGDRT